MNNQGTINLLRRTQELTPSQSPLEKKFQTISTIICTSVLILALLTGGIFVALRWQQQNLESTKNRLTQMIAAQSNKEVLYHALKERIALVSDIRQHQKAWGSWFDLVQELAGPPVLKQFSGTSEKGLDVMLHVETFEEVPVLARTLVSFFTRGDVKNPRVVSYTLSETEGITMTLGFLPNK